MSPTPLPPVVGGVPAAGGVGVAPPGEGAASGSADPPGALLLPGLVNVVVVGLPAAGAAPPAAGAAPLAAGAAPLAVGSSPLPHHALPC